MYFVKLVDSVELAAARQARATFFDNPSADLFVHQSHKDRSQVRSREKTVADQFAQAFTLPPRKYKTRHERALFSGPTPSKDAEEAERTRWIHNLATLLHTPTPISVLGSWEESVDFPCTCPAQQNLLTTVDFCTPKGLSH